MLLQTGWCYNVFWCADVHIYIPCRMTAVCPSESSPEGAEAAARTGSRTGTASSISPSAAEAVDSNGGSVQASVGGTAVIAGVPGFNRWSHQDSSDIITDDEGASVRRLTPLERLNLDMCQDERYEGEAFIKLVVFDI